MAKDPTSDRALANLTRQQRDTDRGAASRWQRVVAKTIERRGQADAERAAAQRWRRRLDEEGEQNQ